MKKFILLMVFLLAGCGQDMYKWDYNAADRCTGGPDLLLSGLTPTMVTVQASTGWHSFDMTVNVAGTHCENIVSHTSIALPGNGTVNMTASTMSGADTFAMSVRNYQFDTTGMVTSQGTFSIYITTATRTSNVVGGIIIVQ